MLGQKFLGFFAVEYVDLFEEFLFELVFVDFQVRFLERRVLLLERGCSGSGVLLELVFAFET